MSVLIVIEPSRGSFSKTMLSMMSYGRALARATDTRASVLCLEDVNNEEADLVANYGIEKLIIASKIKMKPLMALEHGRFIAAVAEAEKATTVILSSGFTGRVLAPVVAATLGAGMATGVFGLPESIQPFEIKKNVFSGKAIATIRIQSLVRVLTLQPNAFPIKKDPVSGPEIKHLENGLPTDHPPMELTAQDTQQGSSRLTEAEIVVAGGRGMRGPENWEPLEQLARVLGAATACSRPVSDEGWRPHSEHVGQTGKIIAPNLYIALGISGAIQHVAGVRGSKVIVAVNKDPEATIFQEADYGVVGDLKEILPKMTVAFEKALRAE